MVDRKHILLALAITLLFCAPMLAKEFYQFPKVTESEDRDIHLLRRPAAVGYSNTTGTRNITAADMQKPFRNFTGAARADIKSRLSKTAFSGFSAWVAAELAQKQTITKHQIYSAAVAAQLANKVSTTDPRLSDARTPLAHTQDISTVNGLQDTLAGKVDADDSRLSDARTPLAHTQAASTITDLATVATSGSYPDLFNKPTIPVACGSDPATAIFDGAPGVNSLFCNITGGRRTVVYDTNAQNPGTLSPFGVHLYYGSAEVTPLYWSWSTGGASNSIYGSGTSATFTPQIKPAFSSYSSKNNYVSLLATYSTVYGKQYARCGVPIAVTRTFKGYSGSQGATGADGHSPVLTWSGDQIAIDGSITGPHLTGPAGSVTEAQVRTLLQTKGTGNLQQQGNADSDVKMEMLYSTGGTSLWITSGGLIFAKDSAGKVTWGWDNVNNLMVFSNYSYGSARKSATIDRFGQITRYAKDGTTVIYRDYTSAKAIWYSKSGRTVMKRYTGALIL